MCKRRKSWHQKLTVSSLLVSLLFSGCWRDITGKWHKISEGYCCMIYPNKIEFLGDSTYVGGRTWSGGAYGFVDENRLKLDTITGPGIYDFRIEGNVLVIKNDQDCSVKYIKEE